MPRTPRPSPLPGQKLVWEFTEGGSVSCSPFRVPIARLEAARAPVVEDDTAGPR